ncbi:hypothetical protein JYT43_00205 [Ahrensia sp. AH-315-G08]|nr:hypothetical protein [Ahrensia sp. AH-315-G08]
MLQSPISEPQEIGTVEALRQSISKIDGTQERFAVGEGQGRLRVDGQTIDRHLRGGLSLNDLHEVRCSFSRDIGCALGFITTLLCQLAKDRPVVWIADPSCALDMGSLFPDGLAQFGFDAARLLHIKPMHLNHALWAAGEAAKISGLAAVVLQVKGNSQMFDLTVSRKLMLRAQTSGTPFFVIRQAGEEEASSAATRWHVAPLPSLSDENFEKGVGPIRLALTLEKNRNGQTGHWPLAWNPPTRSFEHVPQNPASAHSGVSLHPSVHRPDRPAKMGQVVAFEQAS